MLTGASASRRSGVQCQLAGAATDPERSEALQRKIAMALRLYRGQTLLGSIEVDWAKADFPWHGGAFTPTEHFESVRPLFDAELALRGQPPEWDEAYARIVRPGLRLESESGRVHDQVLVHISQGQEARFRIIVQPSSRWLRIVSTAKGMS